MEVQQWRPGRRRKQKSSKKSGWRGEASQPGPTVTRTRPRRLYPRIEQNNAITLTKLADSPTFRTRPLIRYTFSRHARAQLPFMRCPISARLENNGQSGRLHRRTNFFSPGRMIRANASDYRVPRIILGRSSLREVAFERTKSRGRNREQGERNCAATVELERRPPGN